MSKLIKQRMCASIEGDFVVFLIGMKINSWWKINKWFPIAMAMPKMIRELYANPESGFLGVQFAGFSNPSLMVQYWRSFEALEKYARDPQQTHFPAWVDFNKRIRKNADVGIWHETYLIKAGNYETIYHNMPLYGLGKASTVVPASGKLESAKGRIVQ